MLERTHPLAASAAVSPDCPAAQLAAVAPARRFIIRGDAAALASMGLSLPGTCRATTTGNCVLLWLGPDEFLLLGAEGGRPVRRLRGGCVASRYRTDGVRTACRLVDQWVLCTGPSGGGISYRDVHAHRVRQGRDRALADRSRDVQDQSGAFVRALCLGLPRGGAARIPRVTRRLCPGIQRT